MARVPQLRQPEGGWDTPRCPIPPDTLVVMVLSTYPLVVGVSPPCLGAPQALAARHWEGSTGVSQDRNHQPCWNSPNMMVLRQGDMGTLP